MDCLTPSRRPIVPVGWPTSSGRARTTRRVVDRNAPTVAGAYSTSDRRRPAGSATAPLCCPGSGTSLRALMLVPGRRDHRAVYRRPEVPLCAGEHPGKSPRCRCRRVDPCIRTRIRPCPASGTHRTADPHSFSPDISTARHEALRSPPSLLSVSYYAAGPRAAAAGLPAFASSVRAVGRCSTARSPGISTTLSAGVSRSDLGRRRGVQTTSGRRRPTSGPRRASSEPDLGAFAETHS